MEDIFVTILCHEKQGYSGMCNNRIRHENDLIRHSSKTDAKVDPIMKTSLCGAENSIGPRKASFVSTIHILGGSI